MRAIWESVHAPMIVLLLAGCTVEPNATSPQPTDSHEASAAQPSESAEHVASSSGLKTIDAAVLQATIFTAAKEMLIPGAVVLLRTPQGEFAVNYGTTELGVTTPPNAETHFRIASNTKTMTAAVILQLAQEGKLKLDDLISKFVQGVPDGDQITIAELLEMRSGLYNYTNSAEFASQLDRDPGKAWTTEELLALAFQHPSPAKPGAEFDYCNTNYALLGLVVEKVDGRPLAVAMHERLFNPLDMANTLLLAADSSKIPAPFSHGYLYGSTTVALFGTPPYTPEMVAEAKAGTLLPRDYTELNHSFAAAAGGAISTAHDLVIWIEALATGLVLNAEYQRLWLDSPRPEDPSKPEGQAYGYGISTMRWGPNEYYFHGGETPGFNSFMGYDPANKVTLVVWTNLTVDLEELPTANSLMLKVLDEIYVVSPLEPAMPATAAP